jgi:hypothetical protein
MIRRVMLLCRKTNSRGNTCPIPIPFNLWLNKDFTYNRVIIPLGSQWDPMLPYIRTCHDIYWDTSIKCGDFNAWS